MEKVTNINYAKSDILIKAFCRKRKFEISDKETDFFIVGKTIYTPDKVQTKEYYQKVFSLIAVAEGAETGTEAEFISYLLLEFFGILEKSPAELLKEKTCLNTLEFIDRCSGIYVSLITMYANSEIRMV